MRFITFLLLIFSVTSNAQSTIDYYDEYGIKRGSARVSKTESYSKPVFEASEYQSTLPLKDIQRELNRRQNIFDSRRAELQNKINKAGRTVNKVFAKHPKYKEYYLKEIEKFIEYANTGNNDLSENYIYNNLIEYIEAIDEGAKMEYEKMIEKLLEKENNE